jgi:hypothetical protein
MATGTVIYWNGASGWIRQTNVEHVPTAGTPDIMLLIEFVESGTIALNAPVTFTINSGVAYNVTVDTRDEGGGKPEPEPDSPPANSP